MNNISIYEHVFALPEVMSNIFSFVSKDIQGIRLQGLMSKSLVSKEWNSQCNGVAHHKWNVMKTVIKNYPDLEQFLPSLENSSPSTRFKDFSSKLGIELDNVELSVEGFNEVFKRKRNDIALQTIWNKDLRNKLTPLVQNQRDLRASLPEENATAHDIRMFLQNCSHQVAQITILDFSNSNLRVIPPEFNLLTGLQHLNLGSNNIFKIENLGNLPQLQKLNLASNKIYQIENIDQLPSKWLQRVVILS